MTDLLVEPIEQTYTEGTLRLIESLPDRIPFGRLPDPPDGNDYLYSENVQSEIEEELVIEPLDRFRPRAVNSPYGAVGIQDKFSRKSNTGATLDQAFTSECVTHSGASVKAEQERKEHRRTYNFDVHEWYARCKEIDAWPGEDGTGIRYAAKIGNKRGVLADDPRSTADDAPRGGDRLFGIQRYVRLTSIEQIIECVHKHGTAWFGIEVDDGIFTPNLTNHGYVVPPPNGNGCGGHAMAITGFWLSQGWFEVKNSWGSQYGDGGYVWYPFTHFETYSDWDAWSVFDADESF